jgi:hypothetical protein
MIPAQQARADLEVEKALKGLHFHHGQQMRGIGRWRAWRGV